eukprot:s1422_g18.t1
MRDFPVRHIISEMRAGLTALEDPGRFGPFASGDRFKASIVYVGQVDVGFKLQVLELTAPALFPRADDLEPVDSLPGSDAAQTALSPPVGFPLVGSGE